MTAKNLTDAEASALYKQLHDKYRSELDWVEECIRTDIGLYGYVTLATQSRQTSLLAKIRGDSNAKN